jgi:hypothetical protein
VTLEEHLEHAIFEEVSRRMKANPSRCPLRVLVEVTFEKDLRRQRAEIEPHYCKENPPCPEVLKRETN